MSTDGLYPTTWPRCPVCGDYALDGHITCGRASCPEWVQRDLLPPLRVTQEDVDAVLAELTARQKETP
jgi:hypothetical protein